jgi:tetratricopeptide (TPR) repeat protein
MPDRKELIETIRSNFGNRAQLELLLKEVEKSANFDLADYIRGLLAKIDNNYIGASEYFKKVFESSAEDIRVLEILSESYAEIGQYEESINLLLKCLEYEQNPLKTSFYKYKIGQNYVKLKKYNEAMTFFSKSIEDNPNYFDSYYNLCMCSFMLKNSEICTSYLGETLNKFRNSAENLPKLIKLLNDMGKLNYRNGNFEEAIKNLDLAIGLKESPYLFNNKGLCLSKLKRFDEALVELNKALSLDPRDYLALFNKAVVYMGLDNKEEFIKNLIAAMSINKKIFGLANDISLLKYLNLAKVDSEDDFLKKLNDQLASLSSH